MVAQNGDSTNFTGKGSPNPKLNVTMKTGMEPAGYNSMLQVEQWANNLTSPSAFSNITHTYAVSGTLSVPSGGSGYLPPFFMNAARTLVGVMCLNRAGTTTLDIEQNGSNIATGISVSTSASFTDIGVSVAVNDNFQPVITAVSTSDGLTVSFYFSI